jgi:hypothetical protein
VWQQYRASPENGRNINHEAGVNQYYINEESHDARELAKPTDNNWN